MISPASSAPRVSVVVPARNAARRLPLLLASLEAQTAPAESFEVVVVDDGSVDATADVVRESSARLVSPGRHVGVYAARNLGLGAARAEIMALTDADCVADPSWIEHGLLTFDRTGADLLAGAFETPVGRRPGIAALVDLTHNYDQERYVSEGHSAGGNTWIRRRVIDTVGPFDASLRSNGDTEFVKRAHDAGFKLEYAPDVVVRHEPVARVRDLARRSFRLGFGRAQLRTNDLVLRAGRGGKAYVDREYMVRRLEQAGLQAGRVRVARMLLVKNLCLRAPRLAGTLVGKLAVRSLGARARSRRP